MTSLPHSAAVPRRSAVVESRRPPARARTATDRVDLSHLFGLAFRRMVHQRRTINGLDTYNGDHGDNMVANLALLVEVLQRREGATSLALASAASALRREGRGSTSRFYAAGLDRAGWRLGNRGEASLADVATVLTSLLATIPGSDHPGSLSSTQTALDIVIGSENSRRPQPSDSLTCRQLLDVTRAGAPWSRPAESSRVAAVCIIVQESLASAVGRH